MTTKGKELSHRSDGNEVVDVLRSQRMPGMEILVQVVDRRNTVAGPTSLPSEVCRNLDRVYREPKQYNWFPKDDVVG